MKPKTQELILIVDDNPTNIKVLSDFLRECGYKILIAKDGESCLKRLEKITPDLILLDVMMPGIDGFETCCRIKASNATQSIPIIFMTALADEVNKVKGFQIGGADYITKPLQYEEAIARINAQIRQNRLVRKLEQENQLLQQQNLECQKEIRCRSSIEAALSLSEEKFSKAFHFNPYPIAISTLQEGRYLEANQCFCCLTGYQQNEIIGKTAAELKIWVNPEERETLITQLQSQRRLSNYKFKYRTKLGEVGTALLSAEILQIQGEDCLLSVSQNLRDRQSSSSYPEWTKLKKIVPKTRKIHNLSPMI
ncbi:response regulator [Capilliphycus salinus ALCB114379]|uniref:response regulator n=1 Tax=Capilliphycus salinus TaxID=2768948 RepID=UPI0039A44A3C